MRGLKRSPWLFGLGVLLAVLVVYGGHARADVTTDQSASIIIFPKVIVDGTRDTLIQVANTDNMQATADCVYINTSGTCSITTSLPCNIDTECPTDPVPEVCVHQCTETNFQIFLTGQQPTFWDVGMGRSFGGGGIEPVYPGFFDQTIGPVPAPFVGELKCIQVDASGAPVAQNSLKGEAIISGLIGGDLSEYNAVGIRANSAAAGVLQLTGETVCVGGTKDSQPCSGGIDCPGGTCSSVTTGYNACPAALYMNHSGEGAIDSFTGATTNTELTLVPCSELLEQQTPVHAGAVFHITNEFEQSVSCSVPFDCQLNARLSDLAAYGCDFSAGLLGGDNLKTRIQPPTRGICYSGDARCHICAGADGDRQCLGVPLGTIVGNCACTVGGDDATACPDFVTATGSGACALMAPIACAVDTNCDNSPGCAPGACICPEGTCLLSPAPACPIPGESCAAGQTCSGAVSLGCRPWPGLLGVAEEFQTPTVGSRGTAAVNLHMEGSRPGDVIIVQ